MPENSRDTIFLTAIEIEDLAARELYLEEACGENRSLKAELERLLKAHEAGGSILDGLPSETEIKTYLKPASHIGPYKIREKIGEGGMGVVYVAEQTEPVQRKVALKVIKPGMDTKEVIARFEAERQALAFMEHPNIARVLDAGATESGRSYFVMELVRGIPITEYCDQVKATPQERLELFQTVCDAVQHAHQKGIIHRDIKPSNVLVTQVSAKPVVKVIDFGLAKATSGQKLTDKTVYTGFMKLMGTPVYMSPEQAGLSGLDVDTRSDVYSLGILLYELLTGTTPLHKTEIQKQAYEELCRQIREVEAPKPSSRISTLKDAERSTIAQQRQVEPQSLRQLLDGDLDIVVLKALAKDRDRRYETPKELATDVERFLNDEPVTAVPPSQLYLARKYFRRHRLAILTAIAFFTSLLMATAFSTWQAIRATTAEAAAVASEQTAVDARRLAVASERKAVASEKKAIAARDREKRTAELRRRELYVSNMQLAAQLWDRPDGNQRQVEKLLAAWIPTDDQDDLREFTWRYQWSLLHENAEHTVFANTSSNTFTPNGNLVTVGQEGIRIYNQLGQDVGHPYQADASHAVLSSNGRWAVMLKGGVIQLIDVSSGNVAHEMLGEQFSLSANSRFLASWSADGEVAVRNIEANPPTQVDPIRPNEFTPLPDQTCLLLAPNGKSFLLRGLPASSGHLASDVLVYTDDLAKKITMRSSDPTVCWAWSQDGSWIAIGHFAGHIRLKHATQLEKTVNIGSYGKVITSLTFSPDSKILASGGRDGTIELWDVGELVGLLPTYEETSPKEIRALRIRVVKAHVGAVKAISFSPDGSRFASTDEFGATKIWNQSEDRSIRVVDAADRLYDGVIGVRPVINADGVSVKSIAVGSAAAENGQIRIGDRIIRIADGADAAMRNAAEIPERQLFNIFHGGPPGSTVRIELQRESEGERVTVEMVRRPTYAGVGRVAYSPDSQSLAVASYRHGVTELKDHAKRYPHWGVSVAYSPDGRFLAMDDVCQIALWDLQRDRLRAVVKTDELAGYSMRTPGSSSLAFSPDGRYLAAGSGWPFFHAKTDSRLFVWDVTELERLGTTASDAVAKEPLFMSEHVLAAVKFTRDGKLIAADHDGVVRVWETGSWSLMETLKFPRTTAMDVSPDGHLLAVGFGRPDSDANAGIILWDLNAKEYRAKLLGHRPYAVAFSPDGRTLVSTSDRHDVALWDVEASSLLRTIEGHTNTVAGAVFSPDGTKLATTEFHGKLLIHEAAAFAQIDRHPLTLRSLFRLGVVQNQERNFVAAEMTMRHVFERQKELGDPEIDRTRAEITAALDGQGKLPVIVRHPESVDVVLGEQVNLNVEVSGEGPWDFQWFRNGHLIESGTQQRLVLPMDSRQEFGSYHVEVTPLGRDDVTPIASESAHVVKRREPQHEEPRRPPPSSAEP